MAQQAPVGFEVVKPLEVTITRADIPKDFEEVEFVPTLPGEPLKTRTQRDIENVEFEEQKRQREAAKPNFFERLESAATEPFENLESGLRSTFEGLGIQSDPNDPLLLSAEKTFAQGGLALGGVALTTLDAGINLISEGIASATGADRAEIKEALDFAGLFLGAGPRLARLPKAKGVLSADEQAIVSAQRNLPEKVPLTKADVTQDINLQSTLDDASQGLLGEKAKGLADQVKLEQSQGLKANVEEFQKAVSGRQTALQAQEAGLGIDRASQAIKIAAGNQKQAISDAYTQAKSLDASIDGDLVKAFGSASRKKLSDQGFDIIESPRLAKSLEEIEELKLVDGKLTEASVKNLELWRKRVNKRQQSVKLSDPSEAEALRTLKRDYDDFSSQALDEGLIRGNDEAITAWKNARDLRADFGQRFQTPKVIDKIVRENLTQEETVNLVFGGSRMGFKNQAGRIAKDMKNVLGEQSNAFKSMKEEAILRLVKNQGETFSGAKFNTAFEKAMADNPTLMRELFNKDEIADLRAFAKFARNVTEKKAGATNPSATFNKLVRFAQGTGVTSNFVGRFVDSAFGFFLDPARKAAGASRVGDIINFGDEIATLRSDPDLFRRAIATASGVQLSEEQ